MTVIRKLIGFLIILLFLFVATFHTISDTQTVGVNSKENAKKQNDLEERISSVVYQKDGIEASYPQFVTSVSKNKQSLWNDIILKDFNKILQIYSFQPFPEIKTPTTTVVPTILTIKYIVKFNDIKKMSIMYTAAFLSPYSAYPTDLVYTTNIDKEKGTKLRLSDIVVLNEEFVKEFRTWDFIPIEAGNEEFNKAIKDYINNLSDEDLLMGFQTADQINSKNLWGMYSYLTSENLGISISVPNYIGDHVEFERPISELKKFLK